jgi:translation elongation factor EF-1alpha
MWRHALISFPHPLLQQGLVILDTPGLNALGSEPELTLNMLPAAQAVLFVLAADTGVTRSDLDMWEHHVQRHSKNQNNKHLVVALNKIDTLWDDLKDNTAINASIDGQRRKVAELLGVNSNRVFPVSAQKGLVGKVRSDAALLERSRVLALEDSSLAPLEATRSRERASPSSGMGRSLRAAFPRARPNVCSTG